MIAITGAGEYLDIIRPYDEILLNKLKDDPYVLCFPTAAGLESEERIQYWLDLGDEHFAKLNVNHKSIRALNVNDYNKPETLAEIEKANFIYFSGGNPNHLYDTLSSSLAWEKLLRIHNNGGILAGCSAAAMIMGVEPRLSGAASGLSGFLQIGFAAIVTWLVGYLQFYHSFTMIVAMNICAVLAVTCVFLARKVDNVE